MPSNAIRSWNARQRDRFLSVHRVEHEEHVRRLRLGGDSLELVHELVVDVQSAGGVQDHDIEPVRARRLEPASGRLHGIAAVEREDRYLDLLAELLQLVDRRRSLEIAGDEAGTLLVLAKE